MSKRQIVGGVLMAAPLLVGAVGHISAIVQCKKGELTCLSQITPKDAAVEYLEFVVYTLAPVYILEDKGSLPNYDTLGVALFTLPFWGGAALYYWGAQSK